MMKIAYTGWTWITSRDPEAAKRELEQSFKECKYLGYDTVENFAYISDFYRANPQELIDLTRKYGVDLVNLYGHFTFDTEKSLEIAKAQVKFLADIGGRWYNCQNGGFGDNGPSERPTSPEMIDKMCEVANKLGEYANSLGVKVCFHPHYGTCVFSQSDIDYFAAHADPEKVFFCFDTAHTTLAGIDPAQLIRQYGPRIAYMHLKDVDPVALAKAKGPEKMGSFRALGFGTINFKGVQEALEEQGYNGVLCVELDRPAICNYNSAEVSRIYIKNVLGL